MKKNSYQNELECLDKLKAFFSKMAAEPPPSANVYRSAKKSMTRNEAAHVITGKNISPRSGAKQELARLLGLNPSTVRQWFHGSQKSGITNKLLLILTILKQDGTLESTLEKIQEYEIITEEN